jgi:heavy metal sensor kinase
MNYLERIKLFKNRKLFKTIKFRLTAWYLLTVFILLLIFGSVSYFMLSRDLYLTLDKSLETRMIEVQGTIEIKDGIISFKQPPSDLMLLYNADRSLIQRYGPNVNFASVDPMVKEALIGDNQFLTMTTTDDQEVRLFASPFTAQVGRMAIVVGRSTAGVKEILGSFTEVLVTSSLVTIILAGAGGLFLAGRAFRPVQQIAQTAREIEETDLSRRIEFTSEDELGNLAATLNEMIARLEEAFNRQRQFTADASHELRTPLAVIEAESTLALTKERTPDEYRKSLELVAQEVAYMSAIINKLLFLARADAGKVCYNFERVNLKDLFTELSSDVEVLAKEKGTQFDIVPAEDLDVTGDRVNLRQMFLNLLENAVFYTPEDGKIAVAVEKKDGMAVAAISDTGIGIPPEHLPHIFERFHRVDDSRNRTNGGTGLGLAIAKDIAEAHGGKIEVESKEGKGSTFYISLPIYTSGAE